MIARFCQRNGIELREQSPLSEHTTFRIGGPADYVVIPSDVEQMTLLVSFLVQNKIRFFVLGRGSDILASDRGYRGVIILTSGLKQLQLLPEGRILAGAGCSMASVSNFALKEALGGLEFLHGIPGSMGGGVFMNAGAYGSELSSYVESVTWVDLQGEIRVSSKEELEFSYRHSYFTHHPGVVCSVLLSCSPDDPDRIREQMRLLDSRRREKQPLEYPSAGSAFKRPEGHFAGKLIEDCGLKGYGIGGARVSDKHAGFIINSGNATATDVRQLIEYIIITVEQKTGVVLEPEIRFLEE